MGDVRPSFPRLRAQPFPHRSLVPHPDRPAVSGRFANAAPDLVKALLQAILNDLHGLAGRLPRGCRTVLCAPDGNLEDFLGELRLQAKVVLKIAKRLVSTG